MELQVFISLFYTKYRDLHNSQSTDEQRASRRRHYVGPSDEKQATRMLSPHRHVVLIACQQTWPFLIGYHASSSGL